MRARGILPAVIAVALAACAPTAEARAVAAPRARLITTGAAATHSLSELRVRAPSRARYSRSAFGDWADPDGNRCDARNDVLRRDLSRVVLRAGSGCVVASGTLLDRYTGNELQFVRGQATSRHVQIDHVVPVADAWRSGAWAWTAQRRVAFYNDPANLIAVEGYINQFKSDKTADAYLPPLNRCAYAATVIDVKARYALSVTKAEAEALRGACK